MSSPPRTPRRIPLALRAALWISLVALTGGCGPSAPASGTGDDVQHDPGDVVADAEVADGEDVASPDAEGELAPDLEDLGLVEDARGDQETSGDADLDTYEGSDLESDGAEEDTTPGSPCGGCDATETCVAGRCRPRPCLCVDGSLCDPLAPLCARACAQDAQCPPTFLCFEGRCLPGCREDRDCLIDELCVAHRCIAGCTQDLTCGAYGRCDVSSQRCVAVPCRADDQCGVSASCEAQGCRSLVGSPCADEGDCGYMGACVEGACAQCGAGRVCPDGAECVQGACAPPEHGLPRWVEEPWPVALRHPSYHRVTDVLVGYGPGAALVDVDGDGLLDVFLGHEVGGRVAEIVPAGVVPPEDVRACLYLNRSTPEALHFEPVEALCGAHAPGALFGVGVDWEGEGQPTLVLLGYRELHVVWFAPHLRVQTLAAPTSGEDEGHPFLCDPGSALAIDLTWDGRPELLIGCQAGRHSFRGDANEATYRANRLLRYEGEGRFSLWTAASLPPVDERAPPTALSHHRALLSAGSTLAYAAADLLGEGLLSVVVADDSFSSPGQRNVALPGGAVVHRCAPGAGCTWSPVPMRGTNAPCLPGASCPASDGSVEGEGWCTRWGGCGDLEAWGSYMGVGVPLVDGAPHVLLSDWGPARLLRCGAGGCEDRAGPLQADVGSWWGTALFSWGVVVDDLFRAGMDDVLLLRGAIPDPGSPRLLDHESVLLEQVGSAGFRAWPGARGLAPPRYVFSEDPRVSVRVRAERFPSAQRAAARWDATGDGRLNLLVLTHHGLPQLYTWVEPEGVAPRCRVLPRPRYTPASGVGFALAPSREGPWAQRDVQGQLRLGLGDQVLSVHQRGYLRFPSGWIGAFDCEGGAGPVVVEEPPWLEQEAGAPYRWTLDLGWLAGSGPVEVEAILWGPPGGVRHLRWTLARRRERLVLPEDAAGHLAAWRVGERYVPRWWPLEPSP